MKKQMKVFSLLGWMILCCFGLYAQNIKMTRIPSVPQLPVSALHRIFKIVKDICGMVLLMDYVGMMVIR